MMFHYTYEIIEISSQKKYLGVRSSKLEPELDLGISYFSSSTDKEFIENQLKYPLNFLYNVLGIFDNRREAIEHEILLHKAYSVDHNKLYFNKINQNSLDFTCAAGSGHFRARKILQCSSMDTIILKEWDFIEEAATSLNIKSSDITGCARLRHNKAGGYIWFYKEDYTLEEHIKRIKIPDKRKSNLHYKARSIIQLSLDGKILKEWDCLSDAARKLNITPCQIKDACKGKQKTCHGFKWRYKDENGKK